MKGAKEMYRSEVYLQEAQQRCMNFESFHRTLPLQQNWDVIVRCQAEESHMSVWAGGVQTAHVP